MNPNISNFPFFLIIVLVTIFQSVYTDPNVKQIALSTRGIHCKSECAMKENTKYYWCYLVTKSWDYCSPNPWVDYKGRKCEDKCGQHGHSYEWCTTDGGDWGYCSREGHQVFLKHFGSFEDKQCHSVCSKHGHSYYWCRMDDGNWDYCSPKEGKNSGGTKCKTRCGKDKGTKYQWCYDDKEKWQYCSRVELEALELKPISTHLVSHIKPTEKEIERPSTTTTERAYTRTTTNFLNYVHREY